MGTEETKSTADSTNSTAENNVTTTQKVAYGEEKIKADEVRRRRGKIVIERKTAS